MNMCDCGSTAAPGAWCIPRHGAWPNSLTLCVMRSTSRSSTTVSRSRRLAATAVIRTSKSASSTTTLRNLWSLIWRYVLCTAACVSLILQVPRKVATAYGSASCSSNPSLVLVGPYFEIRPYFENCDWINQWLKLLAEAQCIRLQSSRPSCFTARCAGFDKIVISVCVVLVDLVLQPSREDLDMNQHVSNLKYISWVFEVHGKMFFLIKAFVYI